MSQLDTTIMVDALKRERLARAAERSLMSFTKQAWEIIEPAVEFKNNWHLEAIAEHLEAVSAGEIENLIINIPPGCMKSILVSVAWPAWEWIAQPSLRILGASYGEDIAIRDAMKSRDIILSPWYQERWDFIQIKQGDDQKKKFSLMTGGWRMATSVGGRATGEHPDRKIVDDPHNAKQADSDTERGGANTWMDRTLSSRGKSRNARTVIVMQRLHQDDVTGHLLAQQLGYEHLCIPMKFEKTNHVTGIGWSDPRKEDGELLWPQMFPPQSVKSLEKALGEYGTAGQLQQRPAPEGGGILKIEHFQMWKGELPALDLVVQSYDTAFTERTSGAPTACSVWGLFQKGEQRCAILLDCWSDFLGYPALRQKVIDDWAARYGVDKVKGRAGRKADEILVEKKASGQSLLQDLHLAGIPARPYIPGALDKVARAHLAAPTLETDCVYILESKKNPGEFISWAKPLVEQCEQFPNSKYKDYVDTFTQFVIYAKDNHWLELETVEEDDKNPIEEDDIKKDAVASINPYYA